MKKGLIFACMLCCALTALAQPKFDERPKLVVGIVVDQMRWDYLSRYYDQFTNDGFRRLIDDGFSCDNCLINYVPTVTAIGHTSAYTGTTPAFHGICGNNFFIDGQKVYCCKDDSVETVGSDTNLGKMSPRNMLATTIGDQLRLHFDFRSKVVGVSYKDRAAILPAGHSATSAYWLDTKNLCFVSSTYYMQDLPKWAKDQNKLMADNKELKKAGSRIGFYPLCGTLTTDMAIAALRGERLGQGKETDMLCVSYSQTDIIGHEWATRGEHTDAAYLQLDKDLARLFHALDEKVGRNNYLVFLTADHGGAHNEQFMRDHKLVGGKWPFPDMKDGAEAYVKQKLGNAKKVIADELDYRYFLNRQSIREQGLDFQQVKDAIVEYLRQAPNVCFVIDYEKAADTAVPALIRDRALMGYHYRRSGDILVVPNPGYYTFGSWSSPVGTTHGHWNPYDAHIPLLFYGWKVNKGSLSREVHITDIAPTICQMLHIQQPNACVGEVISEVFK